MWTFSYVGELYLTILIKPVTAFRLYVGFRVRFSDVRSFNGEQY